MLFFGKAVFLTHSFLEASHYYYFIFRNNVLSSLQNMTSNEQSNYIASNFQPWQSVNKSLSFYLLVQPCRMISLLDFWEVENCQLTSIRYKGQVIRYTWYVPIYRRVGWNWLPLAKTPPFGNKHSMLILYTYIIYIYYFLFFYHLLLFHYVGLSVL